MLYVVLFIGSDGRLGRTIGPIEDWISAVNKGQELAKDELWDLTTREQERLGHYGYATSDHGTIHIGGLEL